jgi:GH24 family phage-related lysozyme (muramidase)
VLPKGNCSWGAGILAHKGVCTADELAKKVSTGMVDQEFERRVAEAERYVRIGVKVAVNQAQFDALVSLKALRLIFPK